MEDLSIGPYRVVERLGAGGMGEVYLATDTRLNRQVALKYLSDPALDTPRARERLLREARAAAHITHPNIAAIYDILDAGDHPCIVMEYAHGETLAAMASRGPLPCATVIDIGAQLADALIHAHAAGVVHRDLKPSNIVLTPDGVVKVLDFGVARVQDTEKELAAADAPTRDAAHTQAGRLAGTPAYMAPEQLAGFAASPLSDIYSLGATLFELLTGRRPFEASSTADVVYQVLSKPTPLVSAINGAVPPLVNAIVAKAMAKERADRYPSAEVMAQDLGKAMIECAGAPSRSRSGAALAGSVGDAVAAMSRRRGAMALGGAVVLGALLFGVWYLLWGRPQQLRPTAASQFVAVLSFANDTGDPAAAPDVAGYSEAIVATLEGLSSVSVLSTTPETVRFVESSGDVRKRVLALGATLVVSGNAFRSGNERRVTVLVQTPDGKVVSSKTAAGAAGETARLQELTVREVVRAINVVLSPADRERLLQVPACRPQTYAALATGRISVDRPDVPGNLLKAEGVFRQAVATDPTCALAAAALADSCIALFMQTQKSNWMAEADRSLQEAYKLDPVSPAIRRSMATFYGVTGKYDQAEKVIQQVIAQRPFDDESRRILADVLVRQGRTEEAIAELRWAIDRRPNSVMNQVVLGNINIDSGRYADAAKSYERVLAIQPDNSWAASNLCGARLRMKDYQGAMECYRSLPPDAANLTNLGVSYYNLGRFDEAAEACRKAVDLEPGIDWRRWNLADTYLRLGDRTKAMEQYRQAAALTQGLLKVNGQNARAMVRQAYYEARLGRVDEAVRHAIGAVELQPHDSGVLYRRAVVHCVLNQSADAVAWLERAMQAGFDPERARADDALDSIKKLPKVQELLRKIQ